MRNTLAMTMLTVLALAAAPLAIGQEGSTEGPAVKAVGLSVAVKDTDKFGQSLAHGLNPGTHLNLMVTDASRTFVEVVKSECSLESFTDDKGTELADPDDNQSDWLGHWTNISDDKHAVMLYFKSSDRPAEGAKALKLRAQVGVLCGKNPTTTTSEISLKTTSQTGKVKVEEDQSVTLGKATLKLTLQDDRNDEKVKWLKLQTGTDLDGCEFTFLDSEGEAIETRPGGSSTVTFMGKKSHSYTFRIPASVIGKEITIKLSSFPAITLGSVEGIVDKLEKRRWGKTKSELTIKTTDSPASIQEVTFLDDDREIETTNFQVSRWGMGDNVQYTIRIGLPEEVRGKTLKARVKYFKDTELLKVPVKLDVSVGL